MYTSHASDLVPGDHNDERDLFVVHLAWQTGGSDSDADGMEDDWEIAFFGSLTASNGQGDADGDGLTDLQEFRAGTDPTSADSVLDVQIARSLAANELTIFWPANSSRNYKVQFKRNVAEPGWTDLPGTAVVSGATGWQSDAEPGLPNTKFYRVIVLP